MIGSAESFIMPSSTADAVSSSLVVRMIETVKIVQRVEGTSEKTVESILFLSGGDSSLRATPCEVDKSLDAVRFMAFIRAARLSIFETFTGNFLPCLKLSRSAAVSPFSQR